MLLNCLCVALGGGLGAVLRYLISLIPLPGPFPLLTLLTNFAGAVVIGVIAGLSEGARVSPRGLLLWKTGLCGGFTTFSTFSLETVTLLEEGRGVLGAAYAGASVAFCLAGVVLGRLCVRLLWPES